MGVLNSQKIFYLWQNRIIKRLQLFVTVKNKGLESKDGYTQLPKYIETLVKLLEWQQWKSVYLTHGMIEVKLWPMTKARNQRFFKEEKIYSIPHIINKTHVKLVTVTPIQ